MTLKVKASKRLQNVVVQMITEISIIKVQL